MAKTILQTFIAFCFLTLTASCDRPECKNTNIIFEKYSPESKQYRDELVNQLAKADKSQLTYWMDSYKEKDNSQYLHAHIQGDDLCAKIILTIKDEGSGIEEIIKSKGMGYRGAELEDLAFDIKQNSEKTEFIFREISGIVD